MGQKVNPLGFRLGVSQKHISHWFIDNHHYSQLVVEDQFIRNFFSKRFPGIAEIKIQRDLNRIVIEILSANTRELLMEGGQMKAKATLLPSKAGSNRVEGDNSLNSQSRVNSGTFSIDSLCNQLLKELTIYRNTQALKNAFQEKRRFRSNSNTNNKATSLTPSSSGVDSSGNTFTKDQTTLQTNSTTPSDLTEINPEIEVGITEKPVELELFLTKVENPNTSAACLAEFIVEQLEKRVPFRRVLKRSIQKAEEASVEGVKVQISGRLNGAEIARSERIHKGQVPLHTLRAKIEYNYRTAKTIYGLLGVKVWVFNGFADLP